MLYLSFFLLIFSLDFNEFLIAYLSVLFLFLTYNFFREIISFIDLKDRFEIKREFANICI